MAFPTDLEIARGAHLKPVDDIASEMGLGMHLLEPYGEQVVKIKLSAIEELADAPRAKYVVVTAITPRPRSVKARPPRPSAWGRRSATSASGRRSRSDSHRWAPPSASRAALRAAATAR